MKNNNAKFNYRLGTISQAPNWKTSDGKIVSYEPYIREMRIWADLFAAVDVFAPLSTDPIRVTVAEYGKSNFNFNFVPYEYTTRWWGALVRLVQLPLVLFRLSKFIYSHEVLLIRSPSHFGLFAHVIAFLLRKKTVTKYAGFFGWFEGERIPSIVERNFIRKILRPPHYVLVYSQPDASHLIPFIPAAISRSEIQSLRSLRSTKSQTMEALVFFSLGKLIPVKNYDLAIHAFGLLHREHPNLQWKYHLIGDGVEDQNLLKLVREYSIEDRVFFEGKLSYDASMKKLVSADFVLMPGVKEGWPKVVIEGWAVGAIPVVAEAGILPSVVKDGTNGFLFRPDAQHLKEKLQTLFHATHQLESIRDRGRIEVDRYSLEEFANRIKNVCIDKLNLIPTQG